MEEIAKMRKVKPAFNEESGKGAGYEQVSGCSRYLFLFLVKFLSRTGLIPFKMGGSTKMFEFELLSISTLFAFLRLLIITFPFLVLLDMARYMTEWEKNVFDVFGVFRI